MLITAYIRWASNLVKIDSFIGSRAETKTVYVPRGGLGNREEGRGAELSMLSLLFTVCPS